MSEKVRWGIIGAGGIAKRRTLPAMKEVTNAEITALMDRDTSAMLDLSKQYNIPKIYGNEDDLLADSEVDAVYVASPVAFHKEQARKVLAAGKHLLLEKPMGLDLKESRDMLACAQEHKQKVGSAMVMRFHEGHRKIKELISSGALGQIVTCRAQLTCWFPEMPGNWRQTKAMSGGGALLDMGIHCIDLLRYMLDDEVKLAAGMVGNQTFGYEVEDSASGLLKMGKGANCYVDVYYNIPDEAAHCNLELYGTRGSVIASGTVGQDGGGSIRTILTGEGSEYESEQSRDQAEAGNALNFEKVNMYARQLQTFSESILKNKEVPTTFADALETMKVIDALYQSSEKNEFVPLT